MQLQHHPVHRDSSLRRSSALCLFAIDRPHTVQMTTLDKWWWPEVVGFAIVAILPQLVGDVSVCVPLMRNCACAVFLCMMIGSEIREQFWWVWLICAPPRQPHTHAHSFVSHLKGIILKGIIFSIADRRVHEGVVAVAWLTPCALVRGALDGKLQDGRIITRSCLDRVCLCACACVACESLCGNLWKWRFWLLVVVAHRCSARSLESHSLPDYTVAHELL